MHKTIVIVDDDSWYIDLIVSIFKQIDSELNIISFSDGEAFFDYLSKKDKYKNAVEWPRPDLIFLDLGLPKASGHEILKKIQASDIKNILENIIIIFTSSESNFDIHTSYKLGAKSYIVKPNSLDELTEIIKSAEKYWLNIVKKVKNNIC